MMLVTGEVTSGLPNHFPGKSGLPQFNCKARLKSAVFNTLFADNLTKVKKSMETLVAKIRNESQKMQQQIPKKSSPFPPSPVIIWVQQGIYHVKAPTIKPLGGAY